MNINKIVTSKLPPTDRFVGWLKPIKGKYFELSFYIDGMWRPVSIEKGSEDSITEIGCDATYPLVLSAVTKDNKTTIVGSVNLDGYAQINDIPTKMSELNNDTGYLTENDLVPVTIEEIDALFE